jgi:hypothetical protein
VAINSRQKRMSALQSGMPWRGPMVDAAIAGFTIGNRAAVCLLFASGPSFGNLPTPLERIVYVLDEMRIVAVPAEIRVIVAQ